MRVVSTVTKFILTTKKQERIVFHLNPKLNKRISFELIARILLSNVWSLWNGFLLKKTKTSWLLQSNRLMPPNEQNVYWNMVIALLRKSKLPLSNSRHFDCAKWPTRQLTLFVSKKQVKMVSIDHPHCWQANTYLPPTHGMSGQDQLLRRRQIVLCAKMFWQEENHDKYILSNALSKLTLETG